LDAPVVRADGVHTVAGDNFNYQDVQLRRLQQWLGATADLIGSGVTGAGPGGLVSPVVDGPGVNAITLAARNGFGVGNVLSVGDDDDVAYVEKLRLDYAGRLWLAGGLQLQATQAVTEILDEDTMVSDSDAALATQQSIKAYSDTLFALAVLLAGRAGGQLVHGGVAAGENLTLESTAHATKGDVALSAGERLVLGDSAARPPVNLTARAAEPTTPAASDIYLDDGTNTASGLPGLRRWSGAAWADLDTGVERHVTGAINETVAFGAPEAPLGDFVYNVSKRGALPVVFQAVVTSTAVGANTCLIRLYDVGPAAGPPAVPVLMATLTSNAAGGEGPVLKQSADLSGTLTAGSRLYRVTAEVTVGGAGPPPDEIYVGKAEIYIGS